MTIAPFLIKSARIGWKWEWNQLMNRLAPSDKDGNYQRPLSQHQEALLLSEISINKRPNNQLPILFVGRSCPWAHRTWLVYEMRNLAKNLNLIITKANHQKGRWEIEPAWRSCNTLLNVYELCGSPPTHRATVPTIIDPGENYSDNPKIIGNESAQLVEVLSKWPTNNSTNDLHLFPNNLREEIFQWHQLLQPSVNDGVYRCGFARNQNAYNKACKELFEALEIVEESLQSKGPWLCGKTLTIADIRLFPTLIRWEIVYEPLFKCNLKPLSHFKNICKWRQKFFSIPKVDKTCNSNAWREDYFGALFPLNPSMIVPLGPELSDIIPTIK